MLNINFGSPITTNGSGLNRTKYINLKFSLYGVMDSTMVFGTGYETQVYLSFTRTLVNFIYTWFLRFPKFKISGDLFPLMVPD